MTFSYSLTMSNYIWSPISYLWFTSVSKVFVLFSNRSLLEEVRYEMITDWLAVLTIQGLLSYALFAVRTLLSSNSYPSLSLQPEPELEPEPCREDEDFAAAYERGRVILTIQTEVSSQWSFMSGNNCSHHTLETSGEHDGPTGYKSQ